MNHGTEAVGFRKRRWNSPRPTHDHAAVEHLARSASCHPLTARLLLNRSIRDPEQARAFIHPEFRNLAPPETLPGMDRAADLVAQAVSKREKITIFGDYDVDGITGAAMLWRLLRGKLRHGAGKQSGLHQRLKSIADSDDKLAVPDPLPQRIAQMAQQLIGQNFAAGDVIAIRKTAGNGENLVIRQLPGVRRQTVDVQRHNLGAGFLKGQRQFPIAVGSRAAQYQYADIR